MSFSKELLLAALKGHTDKPVDLTGKELREDLKECEPKPAGGSGGGAISWNDLLHRPFGESPTGGDTLTWDGNTEGLVCVDFTEVMGNVYYKISDATPNETDCTNATMTLTLLGTVTEGVFMGWEEDFAMGADFVFFIVPTDNFSFEVDAGVYLNFPEKGVYASEANGVRLTSLTIPGYTGFPSTKKMDAKYLPGVVVLYADEENYLCSDVDGTTRLTRPEFLQMANSGMPMMFYMGTSCMNWATFVDAGTFAAAVAMNALSGEVVPVILYTAEYTPESTASE